MEVYFASLVLSRGDAASELLMAPCCEPFPPQHSPVISEGHYISVDYCGSPVLLYSAAVYVEGLAKLRDVLLRSLATISAPGLKRKWKYSEGAGCTAGWWQSWPNWVAAMC